MRTIGLNQPVDSDCEAIHIGVGYAVRGFEKSHESAEFEIGIMASLNCFHRDTA